MKDIIIVGAGGFGREALYLIEEINKVSLEYNVIGFIDDNLEALDKIKCHKKVIGTIKNWDPNVNEYFVNGIASPKGKEYVTSILKQKGAKFVTIVSPTARIGGFTEIGEGCVISGSFIGDNVKLGCFVNVAEAMIGQDSIIGDFSTLTGYVNIASAYLGKRVFVGSHSVVLNHRKIGDDVFICAGSIVFNHVKSGQKVIGNPAKKADF